jgi:hypothetical protein
MDQYSSTNRMDLDLSSYPLGVYIIQLEVDGQITSKKIVKE